MSKKWKVTVDGEEYDIEYINSKKIMINGSEQFLQDYDKHLTMFTTEYDIMLGSQNAMLIAKIMNRAQLIMNGKDCATGEAYVPAKVPKWAYIFMILHCGNFINGAIGAIIALIGATLTYEISGNGKLKGIEKILVDLSVLVLAYALMFGIGLLTNFVLSKWNLAL